MAMHPSNRASSPRLAALAPLSLVLVFVLVLGAVVPATAQGGFSTQSFQQIVHFTGSPFLPLAGNVTEPDRDHDGTGGADADPAPLTSGSSSSMEFGSSQTFGNRNAFPEDTPDTSNFGETTWNRTEQTSGSPSPFFIHDQLIKLLALLGMSAAALLVVFTRRFALRRWVLLLSIATLGFTLGGFLCPLAAVQNVILKWNTAYLLLFAVPTALSLLFGRVFCGYVCPFGAVQEWLHVRRWAIRLPHAIDRGLRWLKVALLVYLVVRVLVTGTITLADETPFKALFLWGGTPLTIALSAIAAALSIVIFRPFCAYGCPLGAFLGILSKFSLFQLTRGEDCSSCGVCTASCNSGACTNGDVDSADCLLCGACVDACPASCLKLRPRWRRTGQ